MHVLIVEDDETLARGLEAAIRRWGDSSEWVRDGARACALASSFPFDVILLDLGLPRVSGLEVLRTLQREGVTTPVIVITARGTLEDRVEGLDLGADDYLVKPFALEELAARIRALRRRPDAYQVAGLLARGSERSLRLAKECHLPFHAGPRSFPRGSISPASRSAAPPSTWGSPWANEAMRSPRQPAQL